MTGFYEGTFGGPTPIPHNIGEHVDVLLTEPAEADVLTYDAGEELWVNRPLILESLGNVDTTGVVDGNVLTFNEGSQAWVPAVPAGGGGGGSDDQTAAEVPFFPSGTIAATDVQGALQELDADIVALGAANTGDQTISLTGDVTGSGTGSFSATIANSAVSLAKMANVATGTLFYRKTAGAGAPEVQTLATLKTDLGLTGTNSGDQTIASLGLDPDLATFSVPANTTIGAFGKTLVASTTETAAKNTMHIYDGFDHLAEGEPILIFAFGDSNMAGGSDINTSLVSTDLDLFFYATAAATGTFDPANLGWRNLDPNSTLRSSHQTDCANTTLVATGKTFTGQLCGGSNPPDMMLAYALKTYTNRQVYVYKSAMGLQKAEAFLPGTHTPLYNVDGYTTIFGAGDDGFDAALAAFATATGFTKTAADIVICSLGANDIARDPGVVKDGPTFYGQLQTIYDNCVSAGYIDPAFTQWFHLENVNNSNTAITDYYKTGWMGYALMAANNTERFTLVSSLGAETIDSTNLHYTCEQYELFGKSIARMASTNSASRSPIRSNTYMSKLNPSAGGHLDMNSFDIIDVDHIGAASLTLTGDIIGVNIVISGDLVASDTTLTGNLILSAGDVTVTAGDITLTAGDIIGNAAVFGGTVVANNFTADAAGNVTTPWVKGYSTGSNNYELKLTPNPSSTTEYVNLKNNTTLDSMTLEFFGTDFGISFQTNKAANSNPSWDLVSTVTQTAGNLLQIRNSGLKAAVNYQGSPGFWGVTPATTRPTANATNNTPATAGSGALTINASSMWTGAFGSSGYTINDIITALKNMGMLAA